MAAVRLSETIEARLNQLAQLTGRTKSYYIREALSRYLDDVEDLYLAQARLNKPSKRWSLEELENKSDLDR